MPKLHLKFKGITSRTSACYRKEIARFFLYLEQIDEPLPEASAAMDAILAEYINCMYQDGDSLSQAGWLLSGLKRFMPRLKFHLPTSQQYYQNWLRDHLPQRAIPMPWMVLKAMASICWKEGHYDLAVLLLLGFSFFLRTMEMISLRSEDVVVDRRLGQVIISLKQTKISKQFMQSLVLRHRPLSLLILEAKAFLPREGPIWTFSPHIFRQSFAAILAHLDLTRFGFSLYSIRRGGATHYYTRTRDLNAVAIQGRWKDLRTARIYLDDARATLLRLSFPPPLTFALKQLSSFWTSFK